MLRSLLRSLVRSCTRSTRRSAVRSSRRSSRRLGLESLEDRMVLSTFSQVGRYPEHHPRSGHPVQSRHSVSLS